MLTMKVCPCHFVIEISKIRMLIIVCCVDHWMERRRSSFRERSTSTTAADVTANQRTHSREHEMTESEKKLHYHLEQMSAAFKRHQPDIEEVLSDYCHSPALFLVKVWSDQKCHLLRQNPVQMH